MRSSPLLPPPYRISRYFARDPATLPPLVLPKDQTAPLWPGLHPPQVIVEAHVIRLLDAPPYLIVRT